MSLLSKIDLPIFTTGRSKTAPKVEKVVPEKKMQQAPNKRQNKPIKPRSKKRGKEEVQYLFESRKYLKEDNRCEMNIPGVCTKVATTVHHCKGRIGKLLLDKEWWKRGCLPCHMWVETHPNEARELGLVLNRFVDNKSEVNR
jgi:hypothetical protein